MSTKFIENEKIIKNLRAYSTTKKIPLPDPELLRISGNFKSVNEFFNSSFTTFHEILNLLPLHPDANVLDYGCGLGRIAIPFSLYLKNGSYCGIDTNLASLEHCMSAFSGDNRFEFRHLDLYSKMYNETGQGFSLLESKEFEQRFDVSFLFSVFTHILPENIDALLRFIFNALKPGGEMLATFFLLNPRSLAEIKAGRAHRKFAFEYNGAQIDNINVPEGAIAYFQNDVLDRLSRVGFSVDFISYGMWAKAPQQFHNHQQDFIICKKP